MNKADLQKSGAGHRQRLRSRFLERGIEGFRDDEILELLFTMGTPRKDCKDISREAVKRFGSLAAALEASQEELESIKGVGPSNAFAIHFIHAVARRYLEHRIAGRNYIKSSVDVAEFLIHSMRDLDHEVFKVVFLDAAHGIITTGTLSAGTINQNTVYPRELIKLALKHKAAALVVAHNHPSGNAAFSPEDRKLTRNLYLACSMMHINLLDHLIIAGSGKPFSFADHGIMAEIRDECRAIL